VPTFLTYFLLQQQKHITVDKFGPCPDGDQNPIQMKMPFQVDSSGFNVTFDGQLLVSATVTGPLDLEIQTSRCTLEMKDCAYYDKITIPQICKKLLDQGAFWTPFLDNFQPSLTCPIKKGGYVLNNATLYLDIVSKLPIHGYRWLPVIRFISKGTTKFCIAAEVAITMGRLRKKKTGNRN
jgi:hypothetical protein